MRTQWQDGDEAKSVTAPVSLIVSAFAPVGDVRNTVTPELVRDEPTQILLVDLGRGQNRLGGSVLAQTYGQMGRVVPDVAADDVKALFNAMVSLKSEGLVLAYHDRSDGGALISLLEMAFAGRVGLDIEVSGSPKEAMAELFNEEIGVLVQVRDDALDRVMDGRAVRGVPQLHIRA